MRAYLLQKSGKPEVLKIHDVAEPTVGTGQVKIKVSHIGLNYAEVLSRRGQYSWAPAKPYIPGMEGTGEVIEVGEGVTSVNLGQKVIFGLQYGSYAEYVVVQAHMVSPAIAKFSDEENAAFLVNFMTAWVAFFEIGRISESDKVLIHAAAGGVGTAAVQLASKLGCSVIGTAGSNEKLDLISSLGAEKAVNYRTQDFENEISKEYGKVDLVLEVVGGDVFRKSLKLLNPFGRIIVAGFASIPLRKWNPLTWWPTWRDAPNVNLMKMARGSYFIGATHIGYLINNKEVVGKCWQELSTYVTDNDIKPVVGKVFSFEEIPAAHAYMESRQSVGKIVIKV